MSVILKTKAQWASDNTVLVVDTFGVESENGHYKIGDGTTAWNDLEYYGLAGSLISSFMVDTINANADAVQSTEDKSIQMSLLLMGG